MTDLAMIAAIVGIIAGLVAIVNGILNILRYVKELLRKSPKFEKYPSARKPSVFPKRVLISFAVAFFIALVFLLWGWVSNLPTIRTSTVISTALPTVISIASPPFVSIASPIPQPSSMSSFTCLSQACFQSISRNYPELGCPTQCSKSGFGYQSFQKGIMVWRENNGMIYAVFKIVGRWESRYAQSWESCPEVDPVLGPILGFGNLWCSYWKDQLGYPIEREKYIPEARAEDYSSDGMVLDLGTLGGFILFSNGTYKPF